MFNRKYYVYRLYVDMIQVDPEHPQWNPCNISDGTFYVGKGTGSRIDAHERECRAKLKRGNKAKLSHKDKVIMQLWDRGIEIKKEVIYRTDNEDEAFNGESQAITWYGLERLTNIAYPRRIRRLK
jgi:hypothetical protein